MARFPSGLQLLQQPTDHRTFVQRRHDDGDPGLQLNAPVQLLPCPAVQP